MQIAKLLEEYYSLDHEDDVGGVKTRFRYRAVEPIHDGLQPAEILALPDKELNAIVGLRKLAPYHVDTQRIRPNYKALTEARESLKAQGLYVDKRAKAHARKEQRHREEPAQAVGGGQGKAAAAKEHKHDQSGTQRQKTLSDSAADVASKKKRPGPALRRAMKAAAAADPTATAKRAADPPAAAAAPQLKKRSARAAEPLSADEQKRRRLESYGKLTLPGSSSAPNETEQLDKRAEPSTSGRGKHGPAIQDTSAVGAVQATGLSKAAKKNLKRSQKRHAQHHEVT